MRKKIVIANYKMNYTISEAEYFVNSIKDSINTNEVDVVICPNFVTLDRISDTLDGTNIMLGAQNVYFEAKGAYTGETSVDMLISANVKYCIVGHSERREMFCETDDTVNKKVHSLIAKDLNPILCVGESLEIRNNNTYFEHIKSQIINALKDVSAEQLVRNVVIAYEPIWAIGTGVSATSEQAEEMCKYIREIVKELYNEKVSEKVRILYGGSVKAKNASEILNCDNIDGALVGGASLTNEFVAIVNY